MCGHGGVRVGDKEMWVGRGAKIGRETSDG